MKYYELNYLISPEISEEEVRAFQEKTAALIKEEGGILIEGSNLLSKKKLAYPIKKKGEAYLATLNFQLNPEKLPNLEKKIKLDLQILRYLILTKSPEKRISVLREEKVKPVSVSEKKVELKEIEKKLEEILNEPQ